MREERRDVENAKLTVDLCMHVSRLREVRPTEKSR